MSQVVEALQTSFRSERLFYRPIKNNEVDREFFFQHIFTDPVTTGLSSDGILKLPNKAKSDSYVEALTKSTILAVVIMGPRHIGDDEQGNSDTPIPIGCLHLSDARPGIRCASLAITVVPSFRNKGVGREALNWALHWAFSYGDIHRVNIGSIEFNHRALSLYKSLGFVEEGRKRKCCFYNSEWYDIVEMGMLEEEYRNLRKHTNL